MAAENHSFFKSPFWHRTLSKIDYKFNPILFSDNFSTGQTIRKY